jgi:hypothetical protein
MQLSNDPGDRGGKWAIAGGECPDGDVLAALGLGGPYAASTPTPTPITASTVMTNMEMG